MASTVPITHTDLQQPSLLGQSLPAQSMYFLYEGQVVLTKETWLVSFSLDMEPYQKQVAQIVETVNELNEVLKEIKPYTNEQPAQGGDQDQMQSNLTEADKAYQKSLELFKMEGEHSMQEAAALQGLYGELEESFLLPRSISWTSYVENKPRLPGRHRNKRSILSLVGFILGGIVDIGTLVSVNQLRSKVKVLSSNVDDLMHATKDAYSILNVTQEQVHQNRVALNTLGREIAAATQQMQVAFSQLEERTLKELYYAMVMSQIHSYFNVVQNALRRAFTQLIMLREDLNSAALGRMNFGLVSREQLRATVRKIQNLLPQGYFIPVDEHDLGPLYRNAGVIVFSVGQVLYTTMAIPVARIAAEFDVYQLVSVPHLRDDLGVSLQYRLEETGLAISKDRMTYQLMTGMQASICGNPATPFCILAKPMYSVTRNPSCLSVLFMKQQTGIDQLCEVIRNTGPEHTVAKYLFEGAWLISSRQSLTLSQVCNPQAGAMHPEAGEIQLKRGSNLVKLKKGCRATSDILSLPTYFSSSSSEQIKDRFQKEFTKMKGITLFSNQSTYYGKSGGLPTIDFSSLPEGEKPGQDTLDFWINRFKNPRVNNQGPAGKILLVIAIILVILSTMACVGTICWAWVQKRRDGVVQFTHKDKKAAPGQAQAPQPRIIYQPLPKLPPGHELRLDPEHFQRNLIYQPTLASAQGRESEPHYPESRETIYDFTEVDRTYPTRSDKNGSEDIPKYEPFDHIYHITHTRQDCGQIRNHTRV